MLQGGDIVHLLHLTYRKVHPFNGILAYHRKGAWDRIWRKSPGLEVEMTRADLQQLDFTKDSQQNAQGLERCGVIRVHQSHIQVQKYVYI